MTDPKETAARVRLEAYALRRVLDLDAAGRPEACADLDRAAYALPAWLGTVRRELTAAPLVELRALWAVLDRPSMQADRDALAAAGVDLDKLLTLDPAEARKAYAAALEGTKQAGELRCIGTAAGMLADALNETDPEERARLRAEALNELTRAGRDAGDKPLAESWDAYRAARFTGKPAGPDEVLRLNADKRGPWGAWFNAWLGPRAGLEPGRCMIVGARPGAGKTSLAALFAVDALAVGCPVLFWQLELSREETLEHLLSQVPGTGGRWWKQYWTERCNVPLPPAWADLLTVPPIDGPEAYEADTIRDAMLAHAARAGRKVRHACKGLVLVDYAQLLTVRDRRASTPQHELLTKAASMLAKAAADNALCLVLLSQLRKADKDAQAQGKQPLDETALTGADLSRMAHVAFGLSHAKEGGPDGWEETGARQVTEGPNGEARLLANMKRRGWAKLDGKRPPYTCALWMSEERALHGGDADARKGGLAYE
jgi:hypothetical protein